MVSDHEAYRWLKDAEAGLRAAKKFLDAGEPRVVIQNAQLCIEQSAKAIIACFAEPVWSHDPRDQLNRLLDQYRDELISKIEEGLFKKIKDLSEDSAKVAKWHGWSTYGREENDGSWTPSVDLCTQDIAEEMTKKAERGFEAASKFLKVWVGKE